MVDLKAAHKLGWVDTPFLLVDKAVVDVPAAARGEEEGGGSPANKVVFLLLVADKLDYTVEDM